MRKHAVTTSASIALLTTLVLQYEQLDLPMIATRSFAETTTSTYMDRSGIDPVSYPNVKNYIDHQDRAITIQLEEKIQVVKDQNTKIIAKVELILDLMQDGHLQNGPVSP